MEPETKARFDRIEAVLESLEKNAVAHDGQIAALFKTTEAIGEGVKELLKVQIIMADAQRKTDENVGKLAESHAKLADAQAKTEVAMQETQGKLDAVIHMWDDWIRDRNKRESNGKPKDDPPAS